MRAVCACTCATLCEAIGGYPGTQGPLFDPLSVWLAHSRVEKREEEEEEEEAGQSVNGSSDDPVFLERPLLSGTAPSTRQAGN